MILFLALCAVAAAIAGLTAIAIFWPLTIVHLRDRHPDVLATLGSVPVFNPKALAWLLKRRYRVLEDRSLSGLAMPSWLSLMAIIVGLLSAGVLVLLSKVL